MWVKICGIRDEATAEAITQLRPDAIGLNFYSRSPRCVERAVAVKIAERTAGRVQRIGLFVNHPVDEVVELANACDLDGVQLHGDESPADISAIDSQLNGRSLYRAWRMDGASLLGLEEHLTACRAAGVMLAGCLIDSRVAGTYGGTGHQVPWDDLARAYQRDEWPPLILAGGLTAQNVAEALGVVQPWGVDVASGVESSPAVKDLALVARFIENARR